jgi:hypothetical protein
MLLSPLPTSAVEFGESLGIICQICTLAVQRLRHQPRAGHAWAYEELAIEPVGCMVYWATASALLHN